MADFLMEGKGELLDPLPQTVVKKYPWMTQYPVYTAWAVGRHVMVNVRGLFCLCHWSDSTGDVKLRALPGQEQTAILAHFNMTSQDKNPLVYADGQPKEFEDGTARWKHDPKIMTSCDSYAALVRSQMHVTDENVGTFWKSQAGVEARQEFQASKNAPFDKNLRINKEPSFLIGTGAPFGVFRRVSQSCASSCLSSFRFIVLLTRLVAFFPFYPFRSLLLLSRLAVSPSLRFLFRRLVTW